MRILVVGCGSRGDVQPMLAFSLAMKRRGHDVLLAGTPTFRGEAEAFGVAFTPVGIDVQKVLEEQRHRVDHQSPLKSVRVLNSLMREELTLELEELVPAARGANAVVAGGAVIGARTAAEAAGATYHYVAYTPQTLRSAHHVPFMLPLTRTPRWLNRVSWPVVGAFYDRLILGDLNAGRARVGLPPVRDAMGHVFAPEHTILAADPEIAPAPPDVRSPQVGALHLDDPRPLDANLERFLAEGEPPVYLGFGSMPDRQPDETTRLLGEAIAQSGCRAVVSAGWAGFGREGMGDGVHVIGPASHHLLFPRVRAVVHHGGAGTTAAAARAGVPQLVVPHAFDQFMTARRAEDAGVAKVLPRRRLTAERLGRLLREVVSDEALRATAAAVGRSIRARSPLDAAAALVEK